MTDEEKKLAEQEEQRKKDALAEEERLKNLEEEDEEDDTDWKAEALKHKAIADRLKSKLSKVAPISKGSNEEHKMDDEVVQSVKKLEQAEAKRQFGFEHKLSPEETDLAFKFSGGKPTKEVLEDEFFKGGLESLRAKQRLANNTPGSSSRSSVFTEKPFSEMKEDERKNTFEAKMKSIRK